MTMMKRMTLGLALLVCLTGGLVGGRVLGQTKELTSGTKEQAPRATSTPYVGDLSIFEYPERDEKLQVQHVMDLLGIIKGKSVADIGAGSGWFTVRAASRVGADGAVYAEDINPEAIAYIEKRAVKEKHANIHTILGTVEDTKIPANSVDAVLILKTYHEFAHPIPLMEKLRLALKPGAKVGIIDRNGNGKDHGILQEVVEREMAQAGYKRLKVYDFTRNDGEDYFLTFQVK